jgi:hypothetical protein
MMTAQIETAMRTSHFPKAFHMQHDRPQQNYLQSVGVSGGLAKFDSPQELSDRSVVDKGRVGLKCCDRGSKSL